MRMYAACLASYNAGRLHGVWIDLDCKDADEIRGEIAEMLRASPCPNVEVDCPECGGSGRVPVRPERATDEAQAAPAGNYGHRFCPACKGRGKVPSAEEWAAHDWEGAGLADFGEFPDLDHVCKHVELVDEHGEAWLAYVSHVGAHYATEDGFRDAYMGEGYTSEADWAESYLEDSGQLAGLPEWARNYFDFEAYARDARLGGDVAFVGHDGTLYVFSNH